MPRYSGFTFILAFIFSLKGVSPAGTTDWRELKAENQQKARGKIDPINGIYRESLEQMLRGQ